MNNNKPYNGPKLSVIVPVYKVESFLPKCIESILSQTYTNIEVILVDDGSPDKCPSICDRYARIDPRIKVIHKQNGGLCSARNAGLDLARGAYVTFVDSDDWLESDAYSCMMGQCIENQCDIVGGGYRYIRPWKIERKILEIPFDNSFRLLNSDQALNELYFGAQQFMPMSIMVWNKIYRRSLFDGLRFAEGYIHEDVQLTPILFDRAKRIGALNHLIYNYNIHMSASSTSGMAMNVLKVRSMIEMNRSVYEHFIDSPLKRISHHVAGLYFNALLNGYYIASCHKGDEWNEITTDCKQRISYLKSTIKAIYPTKPFQIYFLSPRLFKMLKACVINSKHLKYKIHCKITGKN